MMAAIAQATNASPTHNPDSLLTERQLAEELGYTPRALQQWRRAGTGPKFVRVSARSIRYRRRDVLEWLEEHTRTSTSDTGRGQRRQ